MPTIEKRVRGSNDGARSRTSGLLATAGHVGGEVNHGRRLGGEKFMITAKDKKLW